MLGQQLQSEVLDSSVVTGEKSALLEPDSSCPRADVSRRSGKTAFKCLLLSDYRGSPAD